MCVCTLVLALAIYYSLFESEIVRTFNPQNDFETYKSKLAEFPTLRCECSSESVSFKSFATPTVEVNKACEWVKHDLDSSASACKKYEVEGYCTSVRDACNQSQATLDWIMTEFNNTIVASTSLMGEGSLISTTQASFDGNFKIGELISSSPKKVVQAWAAANMPRILRLTGDSTLRVKALSQKVRLLADNSDTAFKNACENSMPLICGDGFDYDSLLVDGNLPTDCVRKTGTPTCLFDDVANGYCNRDCMSPECLFDGGDCANYVLNSGHDRDTRQTFTLLDAKETQAWNGWMDNLPSDYIASTRRRCDKSGRWTETDTLPEEDDLWDSELAGGFDFSAIFSNQISKNDDAWPTFEDGSKVDFRASLELGCDEYNKELYQNFFKFYTAEQFRIFMSKMRELAGASPDSLSASGSVPLAWACDESYFGSSDGCDCLCGAWDPDCDAPPGSVFIYGCEYLDNPICVQSGGTGICDDSWSDYESSWWGDYGSKKRRLLQNEREQTKHGSKKRRLLQTGDTYGIAQLLDINSTTYIGSNLDFMENFAAPLMGVHGNLGQAMDSLFVDRKTLDIEYEKYFESCEVKSCTYTYSSKHSSAGIAAILIGLIGGIQSGMSATFNTIYAVCRNAILKKKHKKNVQPAELDEVPTENTTDVENPTTNAHNDSMPSTSSISPTVPVVVEEIEGDRGAKPVNFCHNCGIAWVKDAKYCRTCGKEA